MESETFSNLHIIAPAAGQRRLPPDAYYSFLFNLQSQADMESTLHHIFSEANPYPFSITLCAQHSQPLPEGWLEMLCFILCHRNYIWHNEQPVVGLRYDPLEANGITIFFNHMLAKLKMQGFESMAVAHITTPQLHDTPGSFYTVYPFDTNEVFYGWYARQVAQNTARLQIFTCLESDEAIATFIRQREQAELQLKNDEPLLHRLIGEVQKKEQQLQQYRRALKSGEEELTAKTAYLDFLLHKTTDYSDLNEIMKIKKFYHHEYEILPMWYKRFGHVVKVLSGKRTFKSLFDPNVKKYT